MTGATALEPQTSAPAGPQNNTGKVDAKNPPRTSSLDVKQFISSKVSLGDKRSSSCTSLAASSKLSKNKTPTEKQDKHESNLNIDIESTRLVGTKRRTITPIPTPTTHLTSQDKNTMDGLEHDSGANHRPSKKTKTTLSPSPSFSNESSTSTASPPQIRIERVVAPTVHGIQEVARHLLQPERSSLRNIEEEHTTKSQSDANSSSCVDISTTGPLHQKFSLLAMPTECTYEICSLIHWDKRRLPDKNEYAGREERLSHLKLTSSSASVHVYLHYHNIQQIDQLLSFPKKAYATKQNPKVCCAFNESRYLFEKLADQFWPGPVQLYVATSATSLAQEGSASSSVDVPDGLLHKNFRNREFIGFRCPSHPLTVKTLKEIRSHHSQSQLKDGGDVNQKNNHKHASPNIIQSGVLVGAPVYHPRANTLSHSRSQRPPILLTRAKDVTHKFIIQQRASIAAAVASGKVPETGEIVSSTNTESCDDVPGVGHPLARSLPCYSRIQVLHGEERRERFAVPTCQFQDEWLECWIVPDVRVVLLRGRSDRDVTPQLKAVLRGVEASGGNTPQSPNLGSPVASPRRKSSTSSSHKQRIIDSVMQQWKVADQRIK